MPHATLKLQPGVDQNRTLALNEAAISYTQLVRFVPDKQGLGLVQKLGGWTKYPNPTGSNVGPITRALWAWEDTNANSYLAIGNQATSLAGNALRYIQPADTAPTNITPQGATATTAVSITTFIGSSTVQIYDPGSNITDYDVVNIKTQISVGGLILFGTYQCSYVSTDYYSIEARDLLGNPQLATSNVTSGGVVPRFIFASGQSYADVYLPDNPYQPGDVFPVLVPTTIGNVTLYGNYQVNATSPAATDTIRIFLKDAATPVATTSTSGNGSTATIGFNAPYTFQTGSSVIVVNVVPAGYNGTYTVTSQTTNSVSYASATTGSMSTAGLVFASNGYLNNGQAFYEYYITPGPATVGVGYGLGLYGAGGYGTGGSSPIVSSGAPISATDWTLDNWGEILIACPIGGPIYTWSPTSLSTTATIIPNAPTTNDGIFVAMPQRQIIAWGSTETGILDPLLINWCDVNNYDSWIPTVTNQAGSYRIPKGSRIVGCIQGPQQGLIWTDLAIWAMQYVGPPYVYQFNEVGTGCGLIARKAATSMNNIVYWMSQSQFYRMSGNGVEQIRCPIWDVIFQDLDQSNLSKIRVAPNSAFGEITWYYPTLSNGGEVSHYVKYNTVMDQWDFGALVRTAWINQSVLGPPIGSDGTYIYQHETSKNADGLPMNSSFQTGYFVISDGEWKVFVDQIWPDMKWGYYDGTQNATVLITFYVADYPGPGISSTNGGVRTYGPYTMTEATEFLTPRFRGRLMSIKIESNDLDSFWRIGAMRYRLQQDGKF